MTLDATLLPSVRLALSVLHPHYLSAELTEPTTRQGITSCPWTLWHSNLKHDTTNFGIFAIKDSNRIQMATKYSIWVSSNHIIVCNACLLLKQKTARYQAYSVWLIKSTTYTIPTPFIPICKHRIQFRADLMAYFELKVMPEHGHRSFPLPSLPFPPPYHLTSSASSFQSSTSPSTANWPYSSLSLSPPPVSVPPFP